MIEINNTTKYKIDEKLIKKTAEKFLQSRRLGKKNISFAFINDAEMLALNRRFRKMNKTTDVLSFSENTSSFEACLSGKGGDEGNNFFGEIVISPAQIKKQAAENNNSFQDELIFILVHGLLHLAGYNDETEKDRLKMIKLGKEFIGKLQSLKL
jgi:probable rRNA maturation factor